MKRVASVLLMAMIIVISSPAAWAEGVVCSDDSEYLEIDAGFMDPDEDGNNVWFWVRNNGRENIRVNCGPDFVSGSYPYEALPDVVFEIPAWETAYRVDFFAPNFDACYDFHYGCSVVGPPGTTIEYCKDLDRHCFCPAPNGSRHADNNCPTPVPTSTPTPIPTPTSTATATEVPTPVGTPIVKSCRKFEKDPAKIRDLSGPDYFTTHGSFVGNFDPLTESFRFRLIDATGTPVAYDRTFSNFIRTRTSVYLEKGVGYEVKLRYQRSRNRWRYTIKDATQEIMDNFHQFMDVQVDAGDACYYRDPTWRPTRKGWYFPN